MGRLTWVASDDGLSARCYSGSALPVAEVERRRHRPFPTVWVVEVEGDRLAGSWANEALARRAAEHVLRQRRRARSRLR